MKELSLSMGRIDSGRHFFAVRVYYEDTDSGAIIYYASYLRFIERARSEYLRLTGGWQKMNGYIFVVRRCAGEYHAAGKLGDELVIETVITQLKRASCSLRQKVTAGEIVLASFDVTLACLDEKTMKVAAIPSAVRPILQSVAI